MHIAKKIDLVKTLGSDGNIFLNNKILESEAIMKESEAKFMKKLKKL
jgi:hypothetical protein